MASNEVNNMMVTFNVTVIADVNIVGEEPTILIAGEHYTVVRWTESKDNSYKGDVFQMKAVDFPYAIADRLTGGIFGLEQRRVTFDLRKVELKRLSKEYVDAATCKA